MRHHSTSFGAKISSNSIQPVASHWVLKGHVCASFRDIQYENISAENVLGRLVHSATIAFAPWGNTVEKTLTQHQALFQIGWNRMHNENLWGNLFFRFLKPPRISVLIISGVWFFIRWNETKNCLLMRNQIPTSRETEKGAFSHSMQRR